MNHIPWSAEAEQRLRRRIRLNWIFVWAGMILAFADLGVGIGLKKWFWFFGAVAVFGMALANLYLLSVNREILGEEMRRFPDGSFFEGSGMLANKPRSIANLTTWYEHASPGTFRCLCGLSHGWTDADVQWIPNFAAQEEDDGTQIPIDPGGGRYVILCPCGIGHFKLKA